MRRRRPSTYGKRSRRAAKWEIEVLYGVFSLHNHQVSMPVDPGAPVGAEHVNLAHAPTNPKDFHTLAIGLAELLKAEARRSRALAKLRPVTPGTDRRQPPSRTNPTVCSGSRRRFDLCDWLVQSREQRPAASVERSRFPLPPHDLDLDPVGLGAARPDRPDLGVGPAALGHGLERNPHPPPPWLFDDSWRDRRDFSERNSLDCAARIMRTAGLEPLSAQDEHACRYPLSRSLELE